MNRIRSYEKEILAPIRELSRTWPCKEIGTPVIAGKSYPMFAFRIGDDPMHQEIYIHGTIHGNEPAGAFAIIQFLQAGLSDFQDVFNFTIIPILNPSGFEIDTRANENGVDLNRNFIGLQYEQETEIIRTFIQNENRHYLSVLDLHEDPTDQPVKGFHIEDNPTAGYLYEMVPQEESHNDGSVGRDVIERLRASGVPIWDGPLVYEDASIRGLIREGLTGIEPNPQGGFFDGFIALRTRYELTFETPTIWPLEKRIEFQKLFLKISLEELKKKI